MITEGCVVAKNSVNGFYGASDIYVNVRIPLFESAGASDPAIFRCSLLAQAGLANSYKAEDKVWVAFENNIISKPVIIGRIYQGLDAEAKNIDVIAKTLTVTDRAILPLDTTIGNINLKTIVNNAAEITYLKEQLDKVKGVIANPSAAATESLTKIEIGDTVYEISGGSGGKTYHSGTGIIVNNSNDTISIDEDIVVTKDNLDEDNFTFKDDLKTMYTIGKYNGTLADPVTIAAKDKTFKQVWDDIFQQEVNPTTTQPSISLSLTNATEQEVGTVVKPAWTATFNPGSYTYDDSTGVTLTEWTVTCGSNTSKAASGDFGDMTVGDAAIRFNLRGDYTDGIVPHTNIGNEYPDGQILAGHKTTYKEVAKGYRKLFYGYSDKTNILQIGSTDIRNLANSKKNASGALTTLSEDTSAKSIILACPRGTRVLKSVVMPSSSSADVTSQFVKQQALIMVKGANNYEAIAYDLWLYTPATMGGTYLITLA